jgi:hypothetical protein
MDHALRLTLDTEPWLSCDDCFEQIDNYVERVMAGGPVGRPAMRAHLRGCAACGEEARSLVILLARDDGLDPVPSLRRLTADR